MTALPAHLERVHMVGIGGAGMSGIARILLSRGGLVSGSDAKESRGVLALRARGAQVRIGHDADALDLLPGGPTVVVTTHAAIPKDNPELVEAARRGIPVILRPAVLASLMQGNRTFLVSGTHGKTSTTSMLVVALQHCGFDPSFAVGGELNEAGTNAHHGSGDVFVAEADESDGSLLQYDPNVIVVTNIEADHLDYFGSVEAYVKVFDDFVDKLRPGGLLIACLDDPGSADLAKRIVALGRSDIRVLGYGSADAQEVEAGTAFEPVDGVEVGVRLLGFHAHDVGGVLQFHLAGESAARTVRMAVPGRHMALNALAALLAARDAGAETEEIVEGLAGFGGVHRRFQFTGRERGVRVFDDYAHHPTEVRAVLGAAADLVRPEDDSSSTNSAAGRVIVVFQPHLYSRTAAFAEEFAQALDLADEVVVLDVYGAREEPMPGVSGALVAQSVTKPVHYQPDLSQAPKQVAALAHPGDIVITMGAGDVTMLGKQILDALRSAPHPAPR
ncbi:MULTISPECIES: UDP-N-acetylmuramate--L-alanine ligase [Rhodococcus erythropolis group]|jgi:UDP-N-acetylmuramate--alanine ligase|uniref:UDP-N-acetylmuramate--L-alanine ligase n=1 Tax=Rhodococcus erythropolis TaxID=1833 RepID=A0A6G9CVC1_RHOER|nr:MULTISPECIES: UDP-N-acetylmuramate--L-alanine ligase [Rhodococcus erythropolis group]MCT6733347.1 UDP-N-acetylmuramate--L-alanine ligase [Rhodococcus qingshengii]MDJ0430850.1 UDP-N-acetylmuramate--L-alanine ligase [Rhodococcus qingshengii]QIP40937.1 UDP-N-acetylmuramate--L-alanine ligase [Rhodococcus erythropolis]